MTSPSEKKILLVDDEPDVSELLTACIEFYGFNVKTAVDGIDAVEKIQQEKPDLIMVDMYMPRQSGARLIKTLQANKEWADIPVIVIIAHARNQFGYVEMKGFNPFTPESNPDQIIGKTVTPDSLIKTIAHILKTDVEIDGNGHNTSAEKEVVMRLNSPGSYSQ